MRKNGGRTSSDIAKYRDICHLDIIADDLNTIAEQADRLLGLYELHGLNETDKTFIARIVVLAKLCARRARDRARRQVKKATAV